MHLGYINVFVSNLQRSLDFFTDIAGLQPNSSDSAFGYASFTAPADKPDR